MFSITGFLLVLLLLCGCGYSHGSVLTKDIEILFDKPPFDHPALAGGPVEPGFNSSAETPLPGGGAVVINPSLANGTSNGADISGSPAPSSETNNSLTPSSTVGASPLPAVFPSPADSDEDFPGSESPGAGATPSESLMTPFASTEIGSPGHKPVPGIIIATREPILPGQLPSPSPSPSPTNNDIVGGSTNGPSSSSGFGGVVVPVDGVEIAPGGPTPIVEESVNTIPMIPTMNEDPNILPTGDVAPAFQTPDATASATIGVSTTPTASVPGEPDTSPLPSLLDADLSGTDGKPELGSITSKPKPTDISLGSVSPSPTLDGESAAATPSSFSTMPSSLLSASPTISFSTSIEGGSASGVPTVIPSATAPVPSPSPSPSAVPLVLPGTVIATREPVAGVPSTTSYPSPSATLLASITPNVSEGNFEGSGGGVLLGTTITPTGSVPDRPEFSPLPSVFDADAAGTDDKPEQSSSTLEPKPIIISFGSASPSPTRDAESVVVTPSSSSNVSATSFSASPTISFSTSTEGGTVGGATPTVSPSASVSLPVPSPSPSRTEQVLSGTVVATREPVSGVPSTTSYPSPSITLLTSITPNVSEGNFEGSGGGASLGTTITPIGAVPDEPEFSPLPSVLDADATGTDDKPEQSSSTLEPKPIIISFGSASPSPTRDAESVVVTPSSSSNISSTSFSASPTISFSTPIDGETVGGATPTVSPSASSSLPVPSSSPSTTEQVLSGTVIATREPVSGIPSTISSTSPSTADGPTPEFPEGSNQISDEGSTLAPSPSTSVIPTNAVSPNPSEGSPPMATPSVSFSSSSPTMSTPSASSFAPTSTTSSTGLGSGLDAVSGTTIAPAPSALPLVTPEAGNTDQNQVSSGGVATPISETSTASSTMLPRPSIVSGVSGVPGSRPPLVSSSPKPENNEREPDKDQKPPTGGDRRPTDHKVPCGSPEAHEDVFETTEEFYTAEPSLDTLLR
eukprot:Plantae.Rhodophyta-Hildenbrandia_rubra.ctg2642.p1 GENE.Plantae.Rhodophyta-Hildenbrandia_rubra.ctg2642~~Plantae.Rhodophyta-Hildenbrandia_rubra.ctg2642.p1  ORF type:complete len:973 (+),score=163.32 Plantae.Rhodophyta-Hildenbrandia_rubra.ctg2642:4410-7328(+)